MKAILRAMEAFQENEAQTFIAHIRIGLEILDRTPDALLIFSGSVGVEVYILKIPFIKANSNHDASGPTKPQATNLSEAQSYLVFMFRLSFNNHTTMMRL